MSRPSVTSVTVTALAGCGLGVLLTPVGYGLAYVLIEPGGEEDVTALANHFVSAALVLAVALGAVWLRYKREPNIKTGLVRVGLGLVAGGVASTALAVGYAAAVGFSTQRVHVLTEIVIVLVCCTLGIAVGANGWLHGRRGRESALAAP